MQTIPGAPKPKFLIPKVIPPSLLLNEDINQEQDIQDIEETFEIKIFNEFNVEHKKSNYIFSILELYKEKNNSESPKMKKSLYKPRDSNDSIETKSSENDSLCSE